MDPVLVFRLILVLLATAVLLALAARQLRIPPSAAYVVGGMALAVVPGAPHLALDPDLILALFLPPLLQSSAFFTVWRDFRANLRPILLLAIGCVAFTTLIVGVVLKLLVPALPWAACFALGAIISPPDAVSAASVLEHLRIPRRLRTILEGESLVNDASGLVLYRFAVAAALTGAFSPLPAAGTFVYVAVVGLAIGYGFGRVSAMLFRRLRDPNLEILASFLLAWASYMAAEAVEASGVLSTVAAGLTMGWYQHVTFSSSTRVKARATWSVVVFVMEALVFVLIGLSLNGVLARLGTAGAVALLPLALLITAALTLARFAWVFAGSYLSRLLSRWIRTREPAPEPAAVLVIAWAGMRGVVSLAIALALPQDFPGRDLILFLTFFVILVTVLIQGTTLGPLIKWLGVARPTADDGVPPEARARTELERVALRLIEERGNDEIVGPIARDLIPEFRERAGQAARSHETGGAARAERIARLSLRLDAIEVERTRLLAMHRAGDIHDEVVQILEEELDFDELRLRGQIAH
jgi:Na+/H+ antiporter